MADEAGVKALRYEALLFDLDGVITKTADVHARAWKQLFDQFLDRWSRQTGQPQEPFEIATDYVRYVDGRRRFEGVATFLESRGISLPMGEPDDHDVDTVYGLGNAKNGFFLAELERNGVEVFEDAVDLLNAARDAGRRLAVVSASENCAMVLRRVNLDGYFQVRVSGIEAKALNLPGKPRPDTFLRAAEELGVAPADAVVLEDAIAGVRAGRAGAFGLVVGVDRGGEGEGLAQNGADVVTDDLRTLV
ncbi:beta-phosphoglucomutase family hydrolase [Luedemannella helvata]|uniref:Beta-phosphoglucomutase family hydrolase n=1 Tax=Luedemannella helvata TaxID=349315 RepID=A0ABP4X2H5_9ACTN